MDQNTVFDPELIQRYDVAGPRYTSYPSAVEFQDGFREQDYLRHIELTNTVPRPLSLYFHLPFCDTVCFYCACNKIITNNRAHSIPYLQNLGKEIVLLGKLFSPQRQVEQLHWGGGTPTFLSHQQMGELMSITRKHFNLMDNDQGEFSIEVDPRETQEDTIAFLRNLGFNRLSLGIQDFDPKVQKAVNRIQSETRTFAVLSAARDSGYRSISVDLIYGLPFQTVVSFKNTLEKIIAANPDRLSIFNYAHLPSRFKVQRQINNEDLPSPAEKLAILRMTIEQLTAAGYVYIGMDHFAKPNDELAVAQRNNQLYRNFQGYSTHAECDLIGIGITSIGKVGDAYIQNVRDLETYATLLSEEKLPILRGYELNTDDLIHRDVITGLICHFSLAFAMIDEKYSISFLQYFEPELSVLSEMEKEGLLSMKDYTIEVLPVGRLLIRNICMVFDNHLKQTPQSQFSKTI
ncbi:MAG: oxygen-independent coproporphyrinogen III oxidase [Methylococcales bacterium]